MAKTKNLAGLLLIAAILFTQVGTVLAAPQTQDPTPITGTIQSITLETDGNGLTTVLVTVMDGTGSTQTVRLSVETALELGLVTLDAVTQEPVVNESQIGMPVEIDPATAIPDEEPTEESYHPISVLLASFFGEEASVIDGYHEDGFGFGLIAQSLWMSQNIGGDATLAEQILEAKQTGDYSALFPEGTEDIPTNWGQFKKAYSEKKSNLGSVVSGHAENDTTEDASVEQTQPGNSQGNNNANSNSNKNKDKDKSNNGKGKDK